MILCAKINFNNYKNTKNGYKQMQQAQKVLGLLKD
jgi:hypothetical protein